MLAVHPTCPQIMAIPDMLSSGKRTRGRVLLQLFKSNKSHNSAQTKTLDPLLLLCRYAKISLLKTLFYFRIYSLDFSIFKLYAHQKSAERPRIRS